MNKKKITQLRNRLEKLDIKIHENKNPQNEEKIFKKIDEIQTILFDIGAMK